MKNFIIPLNEFQDEKKGGFIRVCETERLSFVIFYLDLRDMCLFQGKCVISITKFLFLEINTLN